MTMVKTGLAGLPNAEKPLSVIKTILSEPNKVTINSTSEGEFSVTETVAQSGFVKKTMYE